MESARRSLAEKVGVRPSEHWWTDCWAALSLERNPPHADDVLADPPEARRLLLRRPADLLGDRRPFLQDGMTIVVEFYESEALNATVPQKVTCQIVETEPVVKGQTAANSFKPAVLDNGVRVMIPPFVGQDEDIVVNTETFEYSERA